MKYSPRPKLNENGVSDPRKFILIDVNGEKVLFEANSATQRDAWVNAITFQFELAKGIAPTTVPPRVAHAASTINADSMSSSSGTLRSSGSSNNSSAANTLRSRPSASLVSTPASSTRAVVTVVDSDDEDDNYNTSVTASDDSLLLFPSVPSKVIDDNMFPSVPDEDSSASLTGSSTIDSSLFPSVPSNASGTIDLNLFPSVPDAPAAKPAPVARRPTLVAEVSDSMTLKPDAFPSTGATSATSGRSPRPEIGGGGGGGGFPCRVCGVDTESSEALRQHTRQAHNRDLTYDCLFPGCRSTYTDESNLMLHLAHVHPTFARDNGYIDVEPTPASPASAPVLTVAAIAPASPAPAPIDRSLAAVEMTLDVPDAKSSLYAAFLLGPDSGSDKEPSPVVPRAATSKSVGKTSADAMAAVAAEKARRERAAAAEAAAEKTRRERAAAAEAAAEKTRRERAAVAAALASAPSPAEFSANVAAAAPLPPRVTVTQTAPRRAAPITSGVIGGGGGDDDDDIPDAPEDVPDTPSFADSPSGTTMLSAVAAAATAVGQGDDDGGACVGRAVVVIAAVVAARLELAVQR
jgi:hypothetical protein